LFAACYVLHEPYAELLIERAYQPLDAVLPDFKLRKFLPAHLRDGAAYTITLENPVEAFARMHALVEGDLDQLLAILVFLELVLLQRPGHRLGFAKHAKIH